MKMKHHTKKGPGRYHAGRVGPKRVRYPSALVSYDKDGQPVSTVRAIDTLRSGDPYRVHTMTVAMMELGVSCG